MSSTQLGFARLTSRMVPLIFAALGVAACDDDPTDPDNVLWEAELTGTGTFDDVSGTAEALAATSSFTVAVEITSAPADAVFTWTVREGTCAQPGDAVGAATAYPDLDVAEDGSADADADIAATLDDNESYIVIVTDDSGDDPVTVACGALELE